MDDEACNKIVSVSYIYAIIGYWLMLFAQSSKRGRHSGFFEHPRHARCACMKVRDLETDYGMHRYSGMTAYFV